MAYSQLEVASSFDCVLKDHRNRRERCNTMASAAFQKNLKELVRDHLCISVSSVSEDEDEDKDSNSLHNHQNLTCINKDSSSTNGKQAQILDRWAAKQAEEMVSTIQTDEESVNSDSCQGCASTLVQMWEARLHPAHIRMDRSNSYKNSPRSRLLSRSSSSKTSPTSADDLPDPKMDVTTASTSRNDDFVASAGSSTRTSGVNEDLFSGSDAGEGENERQRITDIIKRLKSDNSNENEQGSSSSICDTKSFSLVVNVNSLKIRGRQALNDLFRQMEQERKRELNSMVDRGSVSKFAHRGRIQSMLRVRSMERGMAIQKSAQCTTPSHANRSNHGSAIMSLRERFCKDGTNSLTPRSGKETENMIVNNENPTTVTVIQSSQCANQQAKTSKSCKEIVDHKNDPVVLISSTSKSGKDIIDTNQNGSTIFEAMTKTDNNFRDFCTSDSLSQTSEVHDEFHEDSSARSDVTWQGTDSELNNVGESSMNNWVEENEIIDDKQDFEESSYDWFSDIARPRSYWEDLRRGWYEQMLTCNSEDNEIKQLLQRKTVSSFLAGDFRAKMDQMIMSHVQIQASHEDEELEEEGQERMGQLIMSLLQRQSHSSCEERREEADADDEEEDDDNDNAQETSEEQEPAYPRSAFSSWNNRKHQQVTDGSERASQQLSEASNNQEERIIPSLTHPSNEMELKEQMEQLQREMFELRKTMQACLEMQSQLRSSTQPEPARNSNDITRLERKCCICYDKQVDTFLYRCGHMCTCLRCAHELQWSSGKCPMCGAPILDVVRAYYY